MGESFLSAVFQTALEILVSPMLRELGSRAAVGKDLKKLIRTLSNIQAVLSDAEARKTSELAVRQWLTDVTEAAYDAEDVLDEVMTEAFRLKLQDPVSTRFSSSRAFDFEIGSKLKKINEGFDELANEGDELGLRARKGERWDYGGERRQTSSLVDESSVFGREVEKEEILELLVSSGEYGGGDVCVIPIVGMGGLGKTTLAQLVYNDEKVVKHFELKMWVCVSDDFDVHRVLKLVIEAAALNKSDLMNLDTLQITLRDALKGKKYLLVLDDVWTDKESDWDALRLPLRGGAPGSRIIVTTRSERVASVMGTMSPRRLEGLSDADCWSLFKQRAFENGNVDAHPNLVPIGKEILKKCKGLPLAAKTLGGLLHLKTQEYEWDRVLKSDLWDLEEEEDKNGILPALRLSYDYLPAHLKQCFVFCSVFPKDYNFDRETMVLLWIAEGFVFAKGRKHLEDVGFDYFDDLLLRSFFQRPKFNSSRFVMHDLVHDLAQYVAGDMCFRLEGGKTHSILGTVRHASMLQDTFKSGVKFEDLNTMKSLRTIILLNGSERRETLSVEVLRDLIPNLRCLRVLDLSHLAVEEVPDIVGSLKHLRYLDLSSTHIKMLHPSVCTLYNLQSLILMNCNKLLELPNDMKNLVNLRHLNLIGCWHLTCMPPQIGKLTSLRTLHRFVTAKERGCGIGELKDMTELRATLIIDRLEDVSEVSEAREANLKNKKNLHRLELKWSHRHHMPDTNDEEIIECLEPHGNLRELKIDVYHGAKLPNWMGYSSLSHLEKIELSHCIYSRILPPLGQLPLLKYLSIDTMSELESIGHEFCGRGKVRGFPSLEKMKLGDMNNLKEWREIEDGDFPLLHELTITNSPNIASLPKFPKLQDLVLDECNEKILGSVQFLSSLSSLKISNFQRLALLPDGLLQPLTSLKELRIQHFYRLEALRKEVGFQELESLQQLEILCCPKLVCFPEEGGLPSALQYISLCVCNSLQSLPRGLEKLSSLEELSISKCPNLVSFPEEGLPSSLKILRISACANLVSLPKRLNELPILQQLAIDFCHALRSLPEEGLPPSLRSLFIQKSDLLETKCREGGEDWNKIAHIPDKRIARF